MLSPSMIQRTEFCNLLGRGFNGLTDASESTLNILRFILVIPYSENRIDANLNNDQSMRRRM